MEESTGWSRDLVVSGDGKNLVSHAGTAALRMLADQVGLTTNLSKALRWRGFVPVHDRGRVLVDLAVCIDSLLRVAGARCQVEHVTDG